MASEERTRLLKARYVDWEDKRYIATYQTVPEGTKCRLCEHVASRRPFHHMWTFTQLDYELGMFSELDVFGCSEYHCYDVLRDFLIVRDGEGPPKRE